MSTKPRFISRSIWAPMAVKRKQLTNVQVGVTKVEKPRFFGGTKLVDVPVYRTKEVDVPIPAGESCVDLDALATAVDAVCAEMDVDGYDVIAINPIISGRYQWDQRQGTRMRDTGGIMQLEITDRPWAWAYGYGYSVTEGVLITGRLRSEG